MSLTSPVDAKSRLLRVELEPGLIAYRCPASGGHWLPFQNYWRWLSGRDGSLPRLPRREDDHAEETGPASADQDTPVRLCPETGTFMMRYKVGHGFGFSVDRSVAGIWFDAQEWEALRARNFHDEVHLIMTSPWQSDLRREALQAVINEKAAAHAAQPPAPKWQPMGVNAALQARYAELLGPEALAKADEFRTWLSQQPHRREILAYLQQDRR